MPIVSVGWQAYGCDLSWNLKSVLLFNGAQVGNGMQAIMDGVVFS